MSPIELILVATAALQAVLNVVLIARSHNQGKRLDAQESVAHVHGVASDVEVLH